MQTGVGARFAAAAVHVHLRLRLRLHLRQNYCGLSKCAAGAVTCGNTQFGSRMTSSWHARLIPSCPASPCAGCKVILSRSPAALAAVFRGLPRRLCVTAAGVRHACAVMAMEARLPAPLVVPFPASCRFDPSGPGGGLMYPGLAGLLASSKRRPVTAIPEISRERPPLGSVARCRIRTLRTGGRSSLSTSSEGGVRCTTLLCQACLSRGFLAQSHSIEWSTPQQGALVMGSRRDCSLLIPSHARTHREPNGRQAAFPAAPRAGVRPVCRRHRRFHPAESRRRHSPLPTRATVRDSRKSLRSF